jgi:hypothetical protein
VPLSTFVPRGFGFVHHSIAILYHEVPNPNITIHDFFIAVLRSGDAKGANGHVWAPLLLPCSDAKGADRNERGFGWEVATGMLRFYPAESPLHDCSPVRACTRTTRKFGPLIKDQFLSPRAKP